MRVLLVVLVLAGCELPESSAPDPDDTYRGDCNQTADQFTRRCVAARTELADAGAHD